MVGHRVADAIGQKSNPKLAQDGSQIIVYVRPVKRNIMTPLEQRIELLLCLRGADAMDRAEDVDRQVVSCERVQPLEIDAAVDRSNVNHFHGVERHNGRERFDMGGIVEMVGGRVAASQFRVQYDRMFASATPNRVGHKVKNAFRVIRIVEEVVVNIVYPMDAR